MFLFRCIDLVYKFNRPPTVVISRRTVPRLRTTNTSQWHHRRERRRRPTDGVVPSSSRWRPVWFCWPLWPVLGLPRYDVLKLYPKTPPSYQSRTTMSATCRGTVATSRRFCRPPATRWSGRRGRCSNWSRLSCYRPRSHWAPAPSSWPGPSWARRQSDWARRRWASARWAWRRWRKWPKWRWKRPQRSVSKRCCSTFCSR